MRVLGSITNRIFLASALLAMLSIGAAVYFVSLFGFVIWVGLLISWLFFAGIKPPLVS